MNRNAILRGVRSWAERSLYFLGPITLLGLFMGSEAILDPTAREAARFPLLSWLMLATAVVVVIATVNRWARFLLVLPFAIILAEIGPLFTGHVYLNPSVRVPRAESVQGLAFALAAEIVLLALQRQPLNDVRRVTAIWFVLVFSFGAFCSPRHPVAETRAQVLSLAVLAVGWAANHFMSHGHAERSQAIR